MKFTPISLIFAILSFALLACTPRDDQKVVKVATLPIEGGVSAPFARFIGDKLVVVGGCNFPDKPAAEGGNKVYYDTLFSLDMDDDDAEWESSDIFPYRVAYGASVSTDNSLICIGGLNDDGPIANVVVVRLQDSELVTDTLPSLPYGIDNGSATLLDSVIYITGGNQGVDGRQDLLALDLRDGDEWQILASYPGAKRLQPTFLGDNGKLYLISGYDYDSSSNEAFIHKTMLKYDVAKQSWDTQAYGLPGDAVRCFVGSSGVAVGHQFVLAGGVDFERFKGGLEGFYGDDYLKHSPEWYRFKDTLLIYDTVQGVFTAGTKDPALAKAGGVLLYRKGYLYLVCGETKPGIRTPDIYRISFQQY